MITPEQLGRLCWNTRRMPWLAGLLNSAMAEFGIVTRARAAAFLAQCAHESGCFRYVAEIWGPTPAQLRYDIRDDLGNTLPEAREIAARHGTTAGYFWRGRGYIQITGYHNYRAAAAALGIDCVERPELLEAPGHAARVSAWWWDMAGCNEEADPDTEQACIRVSRLVNRGNADSDLPAMHEDERLAFWYHLRGLLA